MTVRPGTAKEIIILIDPSCNASPQVGIRGERPANFSLPFLSGSVRQPPGEVLPRLPLHHAGNVAHPRRLRHAGKIGIGTGGL